jgi:hypothetical protein
MVDGMSDETKQIFVSDMADLKVWDSGYGNAWFDSNLGLYSGSGSDIYNYINKNVSLLGGKELSVAVCSLDDDYNGRAYSICSNGNYNNFNAIKARDSKRFEMLDDGYSVIFPSIYFDSSSKNNGIYLSRGGVLPVDESSSIFILEPQKNVASKILDGEAAFWYRISHYAGLARAKEMFYAKTKFGEMCETVSGSDLYCDPSENGPFAVTGMMLRDFAAMCKSCTPESRVMMTYIASDYLLRSYNSKELKSISHKLVLGNEAAFKKMGLDVDRLKEIYRWSITQ